MEIGKIGTTIFILVLLQWAKNHHIKNMSEVDSFLCLLTFIVKHRKKGMDYGYTNYI